MENDTVNVAAPVLIYPDSSQALWLEFYQSVIGSVAWPLVVVLAIVFFHKQLLAKLPEMDGLKVPGAEMSFKKRVAEVSEQAKEIETPDKTEAEANDARLVQLINMAAASPTGAILAAWKDLEAESKALLDRAAQVLPHESNPSGANRDGKTRNALSNAWALRSYQLLPSAEVKTYESLRQLKNRAAHEPEGAISVDEARSYVRIADKLTDLIRGLRRELDGPEFQF